MFRTNSIKQEAAGAEGTPSTGAPEGTVVKDPKPSPNADWQNDPNLDENGNPKGTPPKPEPTQEPVAEPKDEPKGTGEPENTDETPSVDFNSPVIKQVESLVEAAGLKPSDVVKQINDNNGQVTPAIIAALAKKHGDAVATIVGQQLSAFHKASVAEASQRDKALYSKLETAFADVTKQSGKDTWKELSGWAKDNVSDADRKQINAMLRQGGMAAELALDNLISRFKNADNYVQSADLVTGSNVVVDRGVQPLTRADYQRKFRELEAKGHIYGQSAELAALDRARQAGINRGL